MLIQSGFQSAISCLVIEIDSSYCVSFSSEAWLKRVSIKWISVSLPGSIIVPSGLSRAPSCIFSLFFYYLPKSVHLLYRSYFFLVVFPRALPCLFYVLSCCRSSWSQGWHSVYWRWVKSCCSCCCSFRFNLAHSARDSADFIANGLKPWSQHQGDCFWIAAVQAGSRAGTVSTEAGLKAATVAVAVSGLI